MATDDAPRPVTPEYDVAAEQAAQDRVVAAERKKEVAELALRTARAALRLAEREWAEALRAWSWERLPAVNRDIALAEARREKEAANVR